MSGSRNCVHFFSGFCSAAKVQAEESQKKETLFTTVKEVIPMNISYMNFFYSRAASLGLASFTFSLYVLNQRSHQKNKKTHMDQRQLCLITILPVSKLCLSCIGKLLFMCIDLCMCIGVLVLTGSVRSGFVCRQHSPSHAADIN